MIAFESTSSPETMADSMAPAVGTWLKAEAKSSLPDESRPDKILNDYLNNLDHARSWLVMDPFDPDNFAAGKRQSHYTRQFTWGEALIEEPANDYFTARQSFNILMQISGCARIMCYYAARDQADYTRLRTQSAVGVDARSVILGRFANVQTVT